ncbi:DUF445 family protein [Vallitalea okinawensis]|uniref:DUF445 family protein n=1 Tax=Vallitalea okinawensis TaxID=2078660 RepID=UPI000CFD60BF|nr:DUF445 family protein [Vallitalea okinawensis]
MTEWMNWIITPIVGAVIGYSTNWLAIKMLFRPYTEKHIGNIKIPFTPGLIPKERERIANKISEAVGGYVLTEEVLNKELKSEVVKDQIRILFREKTQPLVIGIIIDELLEGIFSDDKQLVIDFIQNKINATIELELASKGDDLQQLIYTKLENKFSPEMTLKEVFGTEIISNIEVVLLNNVPIIKESLKGLLREDNIEVKLKSMLSDVISEKFGALGAMFVDSGSIYNIIVSKVDDFLDDAETQEMLRQAMIGLVESISNKAINEFISEERLREGFNYIAENIINELYSDEFRGLTNQIIKNQVNNLIRQKINFSPTMMKKIEDRFVDQYEITIDERIKEIIETINLARIIEEQINAFELKELEAMILSIAQKELRAITWLGALLGSIMAFILLLFQ